jgi:hypothetical protein
MEMAKALKGLTEEETDALRLVLGLAIGRDRPTNEVKKFLDGADNLKEAPVMKRELTHACEIIRAG